MKIGLKASESRKKIADRLAALLNKRYPGSMMATNYEEPTSMAFNDTCQRPFSWCVDSGCTSHMCKNRILFPEFHSHMNCIIQLTIKVSK